MGIQRGEEFLSIKHVNTHSPLAASAGNQRCSIQFTALTRFSYLSISKGLKMKFPSTDFNFSLPKILLLPFATCGSLQRHFFLSPSAKVTVESLNQHFLQAASFWETLKGNFKSFCRKTNSTALPTEPELPHFPNNCVTKGSKHLL